MNKRKLEQVGKWFLSVCLIAGMIVGLINPMAAQAEDTYFYDEASVYDMYELSKSRSEATMTSSNYEDSLGQLPASENVAVSFSMTMPTGNGNQVRMGFLTADESQNSSAGGYLIQFYRNQTPCIRIVKMISATSDAELFYMGSPSDISLGGTALVEIGAVNVYSDANKTNQIGIKIYVKINGNEVGSCIDDAYSTHRIGKYVTAPAATSGWMGSFDENSGKIKSNYSFDDTTVYNMSELSNGKTEATISSSYDNSLGNLPISENVAVSFNMTMPTALNWNVKQCFLNTTGTSYTEGGGYLIYYYYQGQYQIRIVDLDGTSAYSSVNYQFAQGTTERVEVGAVNVYADEQKQTKVAREVYVKIRGEVILTYFDTTLENETIGKGVSVPVIDGNFTANSGNLRAGYYDTVTVYDVSELSEGYNEATIDAGYTNSLGALPTSENVAVKFNMTMPTNLNWSVGQGFLKTEGNRYTEASYGGYTIFYLFKGTKELRILDCDGTGTYRSVSYQFAQGATEVVEIGAVNVYFDAEKTTKIGREVYVKIRGEVIVKYFDTTLEGETIGSYISAPGVDGTFDANSGSVKTTYEDWNVARYRSDGTYTAPTKDGYVFAGWYTDKNFTTPLGTDVKTGRAYPKFVEDSVLSVLCQLPATVSTEDETTNLRILTSVDGLDYESVGFEVNFKDVRTFTNKSTTVYKKVTALDQKMEEYSYTAKEVFKNDVSEYFMAYTIIGIPDEVFATSVTIIPSWTTLDGTVVTGAIKEFTINQAIAELSTNNN